MNKITIEKLDTLRERTLFSDQAKNLPPFQREFVFQHEFEKAFDGTDLGLLKFGQVYDFIQYAIGNGAFALNLDDFRWVKGKGEKFLKATLDLDNGYVKREVYLGENVCYPAAYADKWSAFKQEKLAQAQPLEDNVQTVITLDGVAASTKSTAEAF